MTRATQGNGGPDGRPLCWNREPRREYLANVGYAEDGRLQRETIPWAFSGGCKSWASDPSTDPVPMAEGWRCQGCRHLPVELIGEAIARKVQRAQRAELEGKA